MVALPGFQFPVSILNPPHLESKHTAKVDDDPLNNLFHARISLEELFQRCHASVCKPAGDYPFKILEISLDIKCEAVRSDPSRNMNAHSDELGVVYPDSGERGNSSGFDPKFRRDADEHFFQ